MSVTKPINFNQIDDSEFDVETTVSEELVRKMIQNINMLRQLVAPASVIASDVNIPGVSIPDATVFQKCDGSEIISGDSPLNMSGTQNVPNLDGKYVTGYKTGYGVGNETGGAPIVNLAHTHTILPKLNRKAIQAGSDIDSYGESMASHSHTMPDDLLTDIPLDPKHMLIAYYMKIV